MPVKLYRHKQVMAHLHYSLQRPLAVALLLVANVLVAATMPWWSVFLLFSTGFGLRSGDIAIGVCLGQVVWLACWFSLSQWTFRYRLFGALIALAVANLAIALFLQLSLLVFLPISEITFRWNYVWNVFSRNLAICVALLLGIIVILLPVRRIRGIELGIRRISGEETERTRQFRISEWMLWTVVAGTPLAIIRLLMRDDLSAPLVVPVIVAVGMLLLGVPAFFASALRRYWPVGIAASFGYVLAALWFYSSGAEYLGIAWGGQIVELRVALCVVLPALGAIYANNMVLQALGIALVVVPPPAKEAARG